MGFANYYKAMEEHKDDKNRYNIQVCHIDTALYSYQWFCHFDDDVYVNIEPLSKLLQQYDPNKPHYIGKWIGKKRHQINVSVCSSCYKHSMHAYLVFKQVRNESLVRLKAVNMVRLICAVCCILESLLYTDHENE